MFLGAGLGGGEDAHGGEDTLDGDGGWGAVAAGAGEEGPEVGLREVGVTGGNGGGFAVGAGDFKAGPGGGREFGGGGAVGGAFGAIKVPAGEGAGGDGVDLAEGGDAGVELQNQSREVVAVGGPEHRAELGGDADDAGGGEEDLELVNEVGAPVVQAAAAISGFGAPTGAPLFGCGADATGELAEAGFDVEHLAEGAGGEERADGEEVGVPAAAVEDGEGAAVFGGEVAESEGLGEVEGHGFFDHDVFSGEEGGGGVGEVQAGGGGDEGGVGGGEGGGEVGGAGQAADGCDGEAGGGGVVDSGDFETGGADPFGVFGTDASVADDGDLEHGESVGATGADVIAQELAAWKRLRWDGGYEIEF